MRTSTWLRPLLVLLAVGPSLAGCSKESRVLKIGQVGPLTGDQAVMGQYQHNGVVLAVEEANARGEILPGMRIEAMPQDDQHNATQAVSVAKKFVADPDVIGVVGHLNSSCTEPAAKIYDAAGLTAITPSSTNPAITRHGYKTIFRTCTTDDVQGPAIARYVAKTLGLKRLYVLDDKTTYGAGLADFVEKEARSLGLEVIGRESITQGDKDFSAVLTKASATGPELIFYGGMFPEASLLVKQSREKKIAARLMGGDGIFDPQLVELATASAAEGVLCTYLTADIEKMESARAFVEAYKKRWGGPPGDYSANAYDAANLLISAARRAGRKDRRAIAEEVHRTKDFSGATGTLNFDEYGDVTSKAIFMYEVKGGKWEYVGPAQ